MKFDLHNGFLMGSKVHNADFLLTCTRGLLSEYLKGVIGNINPEFAPYNSNNECTRTDIVFPPHLRSALGWCPLLYCETTKWWKYNILEMLNWFILVDIGKF